MQVHEGACVLVVSFTFAVADELSLPSVTLSGPPCVLLLWELLSEPVSAFAPMLFAFVEARGDADSGAFVAVVLVAVVDVVAVADAFWSQAVRCE